MEQDHCGLSAARGPGRRGGTAEPAGESPSAEPGISLDALVKDFGTSRAVDGVSLTVHKGEFVSLLGPSGCGKTTILRMIGGLEFPTSGRIAIGGRDVARLPAYERNIGLVFQKYALFPHMSVAENVAYPLKQRGIAKRDRLARAAAALELVGLAEFEARRPHLMSGGQQQRVALARAIVFEPDVLLLDEPLAALDKQLRERMQFEIRALQRQLGITTVFVTHDQIEAMAMSDRIAVMNRGRIEQFGSAAELYEAPATEFVAGFVGESNLLDCVIGGGARQEVTVGTHLVKARTTPVRGSARLLLRPERIAIVAPDAAIAADNILEATVLAATYLGGSTLYAAAVDGHELTVRQVNVDGDRHPPHRVGQPVRLCWSAEDCFVVASEQASPRAASPTVPGSRP